MSEQVEANNVGPLSVEIIQPPAPLVLASGVFLSTLAQVEREVQALAVTDVQSAQAAANLQTRLTKAGTELERQRKALKQPFIDAGRKIDEVAAGPAERIEAAKQCIKVALTAYDTRQRRLAEEAERKRQEELRRLEEQKRREEEEARKKAEELVKQAAVSAVEMDFEEAPPVEKTETEKAIEVIKYAPPIAAPRPAGVAFRVTLVATITDVNKLPEMFVVKTANLRAIQATFCAGWKENEPLPEVPGVTFKIDRQPVAHGRSAW